LIEPEGARENFLAAKQQRKIVVQTFFTHNPPLAHDVLLLYTVAQTLTLVQNPQATNICSDSNGPRIVYRYVVPKSKLMSRRDLDRY
jgi:hypothetical protein